MPAEYEMALPNLVCGATASECRDNQSLKAMIAPEISFSREAWNVAESIVPFENRSLCFFSI
jgi:hypothetical protein